MLYTCRCGFSVLTSGFAPNKVALEGLAQAAVNRHRTVCKKKQQLTTSKRYMDYMRDPRNR
jgi:hypothetical protein